MKRIVLLLKSDNGSYALDEDELRRLVRFAGAGYITELKSLDEQGKKPSEEMIEFDGILRVLRNAIE